MEVPDNKEEKSQGNRSRLEILIKRTQLRTAYVVLAGVVLTTLTTLITTWIKVDEVLKEMKIVSQDVALLVDKPLEGEWLFKSSYEKYYDEPDADELFGKGNAVIIWKHQQKRYDVYLNYGIYRSGGVQLLATIFKGFLAVNEDGWPPQQDFRMDDFVILNRLHYKNYSPSLQTYRFTNCHYVRKPNRDRADMIKCDFTTPKTKSKIELTWEGPLR